MLWLLGRLLINTLAILVTTWIVPGFSVSSLLTAVFAAVILGLINTFIRPLMLLVTLPINVLTLGLFTFVVNAIMLWLTSLLVAGFEIEDWVAAILAAIVLSIVSTILSTLFQHGSQAKAKGKN